MTPSTVFTTNEAPPTVDAGAQYFIAYTLANFQAIALAANKSSVMNFNDAVAAAAEQASTGRVVNPAPTTLTWKVVDQQKFLTDFAALTAQQPNGTYFNASINEQDAIETQQIAMPAGATANIRADGTLQIVTPVIATPTPLTSPIGPSEGTGSNGHQFFNVPLAAQVYPDGYSLQVNGQTYIMHVSASPFAPNGKTYYWEQLPTTSTTTTSSTTPSTSSILTAVESMSSTDVQALITALTAKATQNTVPSTSTPTFSGSGAA